MVKCLSDIVFMDHPNENRCSQICFYVLFWIERLQFISNLLLLRKWTFSPTSKVLLCLEGLTLLRLVCCALSIFALIELAWVSRYCVTECSYLLHSTVARKISSEVSQLKEVSLSHYIVLILPTQTFTQKREHSSTIALEDRALRWRFWDFENTSIQDKKCFLSVEKKRCATFFLHMKELHLGGDGRTCSQIGISYFKLVIGISDRFR